MQKSMIRFCGLLFLFVSTFYLVYFVGCIDDPEDNHSDKHDNDTADDDAEDNDDDMNGVTIGSTQNIIVIDDADFGIHGPCPYLQYEVLAGGLLETKSIANVVGKNDEQYVCYIKGGALFLYRSDEKSEKIEQLTGPAHYPKLEIDSDGRLHLFYYDLVSDRIVYLTNKNGCSQSEFATEPLGGLSSTFALEMSVNPQGEPAVAFLNPDLHCVLREKDGWREELVTSNTIDDFALQLGYDNLPHILATAERDNLTMVEYYYQNGNNRSWQMQTLGVFLRYFEFGFVYGTFEFLIPRLTLNHLNELTLAYDSILSYEIMLGLLEIDTFTIIATQKFGMWLPTDFSLHYHYKWDEALAIDQNNIIHLLSSGQNVIMPWTLAKATGVSSDTETYDEPLELNYWNSQEDKTFDLDDHLTGPIDIAMNDSGNPSASYLRGEAVQAKQLYLAQRGTEDWDSRLISQDGNILESIALAVDAIGNLHLLYSDRTPNVNRIIYAKNESGIWVKEELPYNSNSERALAIAVDRQGKSHIALMDGANKNLIYGNNEAGVWNFEELFNNYADDPCVALDVDSTGNPHLSYFVEASKSPAEYLLYHSVKIDDQWRHDELSPAEITSLSMRIDGDDAVHLVFLHAGPVHGVLQSDEWTTEVPDPEVLSSNAAAMVLDQNDEPIIVYNTGSADSLKLARLHEGQWTIQFLNDLDAPQYTGPLSIARDGFEALHILYQIRTNNDRLRYKTNASGDWQTSELCTDLDGTTSALAVDPDNNATVMFVFRKALWQFLIPAVMKE